MFIAVVQNGLINFSAVKIDNTDIFIFAGIILAAIGAIWGIRKMIVLGYLSSVPGHWQKKYDREQDLADYKEFRDDGGFEDGRFSFGFGKRAYRFDGFSSDSEDDSGYDEYIGSVGSKSWYYDEEGKVYSDMGVIAQEEDEFVFESYEAREAFRVQINDYDDNKEQFSSDIDYIDWRDDWNEWIDSASYGEGEGEGEGEEDEDLNIGWEK